MVSSSISYIILTESLVQEQIFENIFLSQSFQYDLEKSQHGKKCSYYACGKFPYKTQIPTFPFGDKNVISMSTIPFLASFSSQVITASFSYFRSIEM